ncbi:MAG: hypothetical protein V2I24_01590, partial [Halieaceae bacterium]|nr:hypothetical protein [Halieaceae bacterium]
MATGHFYRSSADPSETADPGGAAGTFITFLDDILDVAGGVHWEKVFTGTNKAVYRATTGERKYLRVDDSNAKVALLQVFDTMSDVDTGTNQVPISTQQDICFLKFNAPTATSRFWRAVGDSRGFGIFSNSYVFAGTGNYGSNTTGMWFGEITPFDPLDANLTHLAGVAGNYPFAISTTSIDDGCWPCGGRNLIGGSVTFQANVVPFVSCAGPSGLNPGAPAFMLKPFGSASAGANSNAVAYNQGAAFVAGPMLCVGTSMTPSASTYDRSNAYVRGRMPYLYDTPYSFGSG